MTEEPDGLLFDYEVSGSQALMMDDFMDGAMSALTSFMRQLHKNGIDMDSPAVRTAVVTTLDILVEVADDPKLRSERIKARLG